MRSRSEISGHDDDSLSEMTETGTCDVWAYHEYILSTEMRLVLSIYHSASPALWRRTSRKPNGVISPWSKTKFRKRQISVEDGVRRSEWFWDYHISPLEVLCSIIIPYPQTPMYGNSKAITMVMVILMEGGVLSSLILCIPS